jgi:hypothetical protein
MEVRAARITFLGISLDTQELIRRLASVDDVRLMACLERIRQLTDALTTTPHDAEERGSLLERLGRELDAARAMVRPYFRR